MAHAPADILVTARDAAGNVNTRGGDKLTLSLVSRPGSHVHIRTQVLDERNGRYIVRYTPSASGPLHLQLHIGKETLGKVLAVKVPHPNPNPNPNPNPIPNPIPNPNPNPIPNPNPNPARPDRVG